MTQHHNNPPTLDSRSPVRVQKKQMSKRQMLGGTIAVLMFGACILSILLPSLGQMREAVKRICCQSNLRQIGQAILLYANDNHGQTPPDFATLLATQDITAEVFICRSDTRDAAKGATTQQVVADMLNGDHLSYGYVGGTLLSSQTVDDVIAFDLEKHVPADTAKGTGINVLLGDGSVVFVDEKVAKAIWARYLAGVRPIKLSECDPAAKAAALPSIGQ